MPNFKSISFKMAVLQGGRQNLPSPCVCYPKDPMWNRVKPYLCWMVPSQDWFLLNGFLTYSHLRPWKDTRTLQINSSTGCEQRSPSEIPRHALTNIVTDKATFHSFTYIYQLRYDRFTWSGSKPCRVKEQAQEQSPHFFVTFACLTLKTPHLQVTGSWVKDILFQVKCLIYCLTSTSILISSFVWKNFMFKEIMLSVSNF